MIALTIRPATLGDADGIAVVHVETWQVAYAGLIDQAMLDALDTGVRAAGWTRVIASSLAEQPNDSGRSHSVDVAVVDSRVIGFVGGGASRDDDRTGCGELAALYVHPDFWSQRVGHELIDHMERRLVSEGFSHAYLWVLDTNERARRFYERHGWSFDGTTKDDERGDIVLREARYTKQLVFADSPPGR